MIRQNCSFYVEIFSAYDSSLLHQAMGMPKEWDQSLDGLIIWTSLFQVPMDVERHMSWLMSFK